MIPRLRSILFQASGAVKAPRPRQTIGRKYPCASYQARRDERLRFALRKYSFERGGADKGLPDASQDCAVEAQSEPRERLARRSPIACNSSNAKPAVDIVSAIMGTSASACPRLISS